jgi:hypothetical protein
VAETALITELETPADPGNPAAQALRNRIRARFTELYAERTSIQNDLASLQTTAGEPADDPTLLDEMPLLGDILTNAPDALIERLLPCSTCARSTTATNTSSPSAPPSPPAPSKPSAT